MTYKIWYKEHTMFDIDIYVACTEKDADGNRRYYTEVKPSIVADGLGHYIIDNIKTPEELEELLQWVNSIDDLRLTLFEGYPSMDENWENKPIDCHDADMRMCKVHIPVLKSDMNAFCNKFGLQMSED
jgi:hypothetical protein